MRKVFGYHFLQYDPVEACWGRLRLHARRGGQEVLGLKHPSHVSAALGAHADPPQVAGEPGALFLPVTNAATA